MAGRRNQMDTSEGMAASDRSHSIQPTRDCRKQASPEGGLWRKYARGRRARCRCASGYSLMKNAIGALAK
jgi:hypothetical protein